MKRLMLVAMSLLVLMLFSCANGSDDALSGGNGTGGGQSGSFNAGWYKYNDGTTTMYLKYDASKKLENAGDNRGAFDTSRINNVLKTSHTYDNVKNYLTYYSDEFDYTKPDWTKPQFDLKFDGFVMKGGATYDESTKTITLRNINDGFDIKTKIYRRNTQEVINTSCVDDNRLMLQRGWMDRDGLTQQNFSNFFDVNSQKSVIYMVNVGAEKNFKLNLFQEFYDCNGNETNNATNNVWALEGVTVKVLAVN